MRLGSSSTLGSPKKSAPDGSATSRVTGLQPVAPPANLQKLSLVELCCHTTYAVPAASTATAGGTFGAVPTARGVPVLAGEDVLVAVVVEGNPLLGGRLMLEGRAPLLSGKAVAVGPPVTAWTRAPAPAKQRSTTVGEAQVVDAVG